MNDHIDDDVNRRLRAANPVPSGRADLPSGRHLDDLLEDTMSTPTDQTTGRGTRWRLMAAAAAVVAAAGGTSAYLATRDSGSKHEAKSVLHLKAPAGNPAMSMCIRFDVEQLAQAQVAFSGTVDSVADGVAKIGVDHWYKGGDADEVDLAVPTDENVTLEIGLTVEAGHRYLISANDGTVAGCGYSGEYTDEMAGNFEQAFSS